MSKVKYSPKLSILLPVRNEGTNAEMMLRVLTAVVRTEHEILVIYDFSEDDTLPVVKRLRKELKNIRIVKNNFGSGIPNAIKSGINEALGRYILIFAMDDAGPALAINDMIDLLDKGCDFISCTRYAYGGRRLGGSWVESLLSKIANKLFNLIINSSLTDSTTGFKMFRKSVHKKFNLQSAPKGWAVVFEMAIKAQAAGLKLGEVPIISIDRLYGGKSTFDLKYWLSEYLRWFIWGIIHLRNIKNREVAVKIPHSTAI